MVYPFTIEDEIDVEATPQEVWDAITAGPRIDSWFMGRTEIERHRGGAARTDFGGHVIKSEVTAWDPPNRFAYRSGEGPYGAHMEFTWKITPRNGHGATVHFTHSGVLSGEEPEAVLEVLKKGDPMYLRKLGRYLEYFRGQIATRNISAIGPPRQDLQSFWLVLTRALGLTNPVREWDAVHAKLDGLAPIEGVVDYVTREFLGVRTSTALFRFILAPGGVVMVEHHDFAPDPDATESVERWQSWLTEVFA
jgi:uncharacterized protein YndB with AHSA1/START domain